MNQKEKVEKGKNDCKASSFQQEVVNPVFVDAIGKRKVWAGEDVLDKVSKPTLAEKTSDLTSRKAYASKGLGEDADRANSFAETVDFNGLKDKDSYGLVRDRENLFWF